MRLISKMLIKLFLILIFSIFVLATYFLPILLMYFFDITLWNGFGFMLFCIWVIFLGNPINSLKKPRNLHSDVVRKILYFADNLKFPSTLELKNEDYEINKVALGLVAEHNQLALKMREKRGNTSLFEFTNTSEWLRITEIYKELNNLGYDPTQMEELESLTRD